MSLDIIQDTYHPVTNPLLHRKGAFSLCIDGSNFEDPILLNLLCLLFLSRKILKKNTWLVDTVLVQNPTDSSSCHPKGSLYRRTVSKWFRSDVWSFGSARLSKGNLPKKPTQASKKTGITFRPRSPITNLDFDEPWFRGPKNSRESVGLRQVTRNNLS